MTPPPCPAPAPHVGVSQVQRPPRLQNPDINVDERLRAAFGDDYGLLVETAEGAGTKVTVRLPKFRPGVHV